MMVPCGLKHVGILSVKIKCKHLRKNILLVECSEYQQCMKQHKGILNCGEAFSPHMKLFKGNTMVWLVRSGKTGVNQTKGQIQQNSFNPLSDNLVLEKGSPKTKNFAFYQQKTSSV